jgi:FMN phosphatase YigB (HAD superfamily)
VAAYIEAEKEQEATYMKYRHVLRSASLCAAERLGADLGQERAAIIADSLPTWPPFPDTAASLRELRERGYSLYILSNVDSDQLLMTIRNC